MFKNHVIIDAVKSSVGRLKGFWIYAKTALSEINEKQIIKHPGDVKRNLEEIVQLRACYYYKFQNADNFHFFKTRKPRMSTDWSDVKFSIEKPVYKRIASIDDCRITSETVFNNKSDIDQQHTVKTERQDYVIKKSCITTGFTIGMPNGYGLSLHGKQEHTDGTKGAMLVEDCINVPQKSAIKVSMLSTDKEMDCTFTRKIGVEGKVKVLFYNKNEEITNEFVIPMNTIINEEFPKRMTEAKGNKHYIIISGRCKCIYKVDKIVIT